MGNLVIRAFDFSRVFLLLFFFIGFLLITTDGMENISAHAVTLAAGGAFTLAVIFGTFDWLARQFSLRALNVFILGSLLGYLFSLTFLSCLSQLTQWAPSLLPESKWITGIRFSMLMFGIYFGISLVSRASDELYMSIPLVRFRFQNNKKKDLLVDKSALLDSRLLDLAGCGMLDHRLVIARHVIKEIQDALCLSDDTLRQRARRSLDMINSLEMLPRLNLRLYETEFPEVHDPLQKMIKIARSIDADILTSSAEPTSLTQIEDIRLINLQALASSMQPALYVGEQIQIKIKKTGKEPTQGIGFLEDGSMIVVNGAGDKVAQTVRCSILSSKRSMNGRLIFANLVNGSGAMEPSELPTAFFADSSNEP